MTTLENLLDGEPFKFKTGFICYCCLNSNIFIKRKLESYIIVYCYNCNEDYVFAITHEIDLVRYIVI